MNSIIIVVFNYDFAIITGCHNEKDEEIRLHILVSFIICLNCQKNMGGWHCRSKKIRWIVLTRIRVDKEISVSSDIDQKVDWWKKMHGREKWVSSSFSAMCSQKKKFLIAMVSSTWFIFYDTWKVVFALCATSLQSCLTLCNSMDCSPLGSTVHGILQARILGHVAISSSRDSPQPRDLTYISYDSCIGRCVLYH